MSVSAAPCPTDFRLLTPEERQASMHATLAAGWNGDDDLWIFGYGSLIWKPEFAHTEQRLGMVRGYHRALCLWSRVNRGTPQNPGLVFGLDRGGACRGMAFRLASADVPSVFPALWEREMPSGAYLPRWLRCETAQGDVRALVFVMDRNSPGYAGQLTRDEVIAAVRRGCGRYGQCVDYVASTARALREHGIADHRLERIVHQLDVAAEAVPAG
ncbi:gamma-glutamylcyclotransferase [Achromobacter sp. GG226]|uniref:gamma-glutamylcyclotransferase n=1 Tax=Verticiella alkaliphila TaxID=2779529 RepID=UPI001C0D241F|nr:gamma-glutamylcyclotransferase [Verticiella sp. GG226]MBU4609956.1 gamma-glutamylcyclotransferase [Verticiella sp. GG226]